MSYLSPCRPTAGTKSRLGRRSMRRRSIMLVILPVLAAASIPMTGLAQAATPSTKLVIASAAFSTPASVATKKPVTIKLENADGTAVPSPTDLTLSLSGSSAGKIFSATAGVLADEKKGETHDCAGKNSCKGKGGCASKDDAPKTDSKPKG